LYKKKMILSKYDKHFRAMNHECDFYLINVGIYIIIRHIG